ncbi:hypothetical protein FJY90_07850, partial [Candidatus Gottesmanbacteria bacterium]|nr:hypothetical protein [Candidatus Gottesmanbacteria bacterium]
MKMKRIKKNRTFFLATVVRMIKKRIYWLLGLIAVVIILFSLVRPISNQIHAANFCDSVTQIPQAECQALVALYQSTNGPSWYVRDGWLTTTTPCSWSRIFCNAGHVYYINLTANNLEGTLPAELGNLSGIRYLYLGYNKLQGSIPPELGNLTQLLHLVVYNNQLSGSIPPELGNLSSLINFFAYSNQLSGSMPPELGNL